MIIKKLFNSTIGLIGTITGLSAWSVGCDLGGDVYGPSPSYYCCKEFYHYGGNYDEVAYMECERQYSGPDRIGATPNCKGIDYDGIKKDYQRRLDKCCKDLQEIEMEAYQKCIEVFSEGYYVDHCPDIEDIELGNEDESGNEDQTDQEDQ